MTAKGDKGTVFCPFWSFSLLHCQLHRGYQVIVTDANRNPTKVFERLSVSVQEAFLPLRWKCHHERFPREAQPQHEDLYNLPNTTNDRGCFSPIALGILTRF